MNKRIPRYCLKIIQIIFWVIISNYSIAQYFRVNLAFNHQPFEKKGLYLSDLLNFNEQIELISIQKPQKLNQIRVELSKTNWEPFQKTLEIDFSSVSEPGEYYFLEKKSGTKSDVFSIGTMQNWHEEVVTFMQTQRCGFNPFTGQFCHQKDGLSFYGSIPDSTQIDARGGWHDAGDQLKYLITGSNATARMLHAYMELPGSFKDKVNEAGLPGKNGIPDILDEAKWGLQWLLKLHPSANVLYHQVADDRDHRGFKLPHLENADYGWGPNSYRPAYAATGSPQGLGKYKSKATGFANLAGRTAAALAMGYEVFSKIESQKAFADSCLKAAIEVYDLGKKNEGYQQGNSYGAPYRYEENTWADDMEWGAAQLFKITNQQLYLKDARKYSKMINTWSWMERDTSSHYEMYPYVNMGHYALWQIGNKQDKIRVAEYYRQNLDKIAQKATLNPYGVGHLFIWCSNNLAAAVATQAILYRKMTNDNTFDNLIYSHSSWLMGRNPWGTSMVTGLPENNDWPLDVHMPFWKIEGKVVKGSLVDGPLWSKIHDKMLAITLSEPDEYKGMHPPHVKYHDDFADYSTNEPTMDGSADTIFLFAWLHSLQP